MRAYLRTAFNRARKAGIWTGANPAADTEPRKVPKRAYVTLTAEDLRGPVADAWGGAPIETVSEPAELVAEAVGGSNSARHVTRLLPEGENHNDDEAARARNLPIVLGNLLARPVYQLSNQRNPLICQPLLRRVKTCTRSNTSSFCYTPTASK